MDCVLDPESSGGNEACTIQSQGLDRRPSSRRFTDDMRAILTPSEMILPRFTAGIEERDYLIRGWVLAGCLIAFVRVATTTTITKIL